MNHKKTSLLILTFSIIFLSFCIKIQTNNTTTVDATNNYTDSEKENVYKIAKNDSEKTVTTTLELGFPEKTQRKETTSQKRKRRQEEKERKKQNKENMIDDMN